MTVQEMSFCIHCASWAIVCLRFSTRCHQQYNVCQDY